MHNYTYPVNMGKPTSFSPTLAGEMAEHFRINFQKYLPKADSMGNFDPNSFSLAKLKAIENRIL